MSFRVIRIDQGRSAPISPKSGMAERAFSVHDAVMHTTGLSFGLTPTQERTLRSLLSARLQRAERQTIGPEASSLLPVSARAALGPSQTECAVGNKRPHQR